jgi:hypothetical protein
MPTSAATLRVASLYRVADCSARDVDGSSEISSAFSYLKGENYSDVARLEVCTALKVQVDFFWVVSPCSVAVGYRRFGGHCNLCLQVKANGARSPLPASCRLPESALSRSRPFLQHHSLCFQTFRLISMEREEDDWENVEVVVAYEVLFQHEGLGE